MTTKLDRATRNRLALAIQHRCRSHAGDNERALDRITKAAATIAELLEKKRDLGITRDEVVQLGKLEARVRRAVLELDAGASALTVEFPRDDYTGHVVILRGAAHGITNRPDGVGWGW